ncbi:helix-turn-helix domain-containing protein [Chryseobacterium sp. MFBS3-17]|uniref:helix-turn-helix domain-containing protein n=1 Tax=Chryseobacterium sp. MFBS3-17 TaxID=2886689 RepID=UPI001D0EFC0E|nr:helix-turn-helix transcriptional regulator [Chryseobacterium sp. MFBS3-17]MCC2590497.1 helix-turn-helix domain-containing protein [Chryseobacterium sp. MFBS3-17]
MRTWRTSRICRSGYRKIETGDTKPTIERLMQISKVLQTPLDNLLDLDSQKNFNQENKDRSQGFQGFNDNIFNEYSDLPRKLIASYEKEIEDLKNQLEYWKKEAIK